MKTVRVSINGFGRIGRNVAKILLARPDIELIAVNDLADVKTLAHLFMYDSVYGNYQGSVKVVKNQMTVDKHPIHFFNEANPENLPWKKLNIDVVIDCTGQFLTTELAQSHLDSGAKRVVLSAPPKDDVTNIFVIGVNEKKLDVRDMIISNASCTTNAIAPLMSVIDKAFGIKKSLMTTVHAITATQKTLDSPARDLRMSRSAGYNIIPTTTGASKAVTQILPNLKNKFEGLSIRVPVPIVSLVDFSILLEQKVTIKDLNDVLIEASKQPFFQGILEVTNQELVSSDFIGHPASLIVDLQLTNVVDGDLVKVVAWYDNEWGYSNRLVEMTCDVGRKMQLEDKKNAKK